MSNPGLVRKFFQVGILLCALLLIGRPGIAQKFPAWLYEPPGDTHHLYGIGISPKFLEDSLTVLVAKQHAIENLTKQYSVIVESKFAEAADGMGILSTGYTREFVDSTHVWQCGAAAELVDSLSNNKYLFVLMRVGRDLNSPEGPVQVTSGLVRKPSGKAPAWVDSLPQKSGTFYGIGISKAYTNVADAWDASAREARRDIALNLSTNSSTLSRELVTEQGTYHRHWSEDTTRKTLQYSVIEARWYEPATDLFYTLVSYSPEAEH